MSSKCPNCQLRSLIKEYYYSNKVKLDIYRAYCLNCGHRVEPDEYKNLKVTGISNQYKEQKRGCNHESHKSTILCGIATGGNRGSRVVRTKRY